jgi:PAS domain S-box-containing protein
MLFHLSWITVIWSMTASACLTLALVNAFIWWWRREAQSNGIFALLALTVVAYAASEFGLMRATTVEMYGLVLRWMHVPLFVAILLLVAFVRIHLQAGRLWLAWTIGGIRAFSLFLNFFFTPNLNYREITALRPIRFLGETISVAKGVPNAWMLVGQAALLLLVIFVVDAMITVWRRGDRLQARGLIGAIALMIVVGALQTFLRYWANLPFPLVTSLFFSGVVLAMGLELSWEVIRAGRVAEALKESEGRFRQLTEAAFEGICISEHGTVCAINDQGLKMLGYQREELIGKAIAELVAPESRAMVAEALRTGQEGRYEHQLLRKDGSKVFVEAQAKMARVGNRTVRMTALRDITERKDAEATLAALAIRHQTLLQTARESIHVLDEQGKVVEANAAFGAMLGYTQEEALQLSVMDWDANWSKAELLEKIGVLMEHSAVFETRHRRKDGILIDVEISAVSVTLEGRRYLYNAARDITERKRAEAALAQERNLLRTLIDHIPSMIFVRDLSNRFLIVNQAFARRMGVASPAELIGKTDGDFFPAQVADQFAADDRKIFAGGELLDYDFSPTFPNGEQLDVLVTKVPLRNAQGEVIGLVGVSHEVTERKRALAALQESEARFRQSQKMEGIGQLAGGVAHDFNNILAALLMQTDLVATVEPLPAEARAGLQEIRRDVQRAAELTRQLLLFSRRQVMQPKLLDLNELVMNLGKLLQRIIGEDVHLQLHPHPVALMTRADAGMLEQVLMNLCVNARDAMPGGGWLLIKTTRMEVNEATARLNPEAAPGHFVSLSVSDTGKGIPLEILPKIFEPFFTTKEPGKGTGLGLATVFGIVKQHQGWVQVDNRPGQGVTFQVFLPASAEPVAEGSPAEMAPPPRGGTETILVVEDEAVVRKLVRKMLERHGYQVLEASNGGEALQRWEHHPGTVALLLTDLVMPGGMSGQELARQLVAQQPQLKVIYTSGYSAEIAGREFQMRPGEAFLQKPCPTAQLVETVRRSLDG